MLKAAIEVLTLLAGGTLAVQSVVLAASLFQKTPAAALRPAVATAVAVVPSKLQKQKGRQEGALRGGAEVQASNISPWKKEPDREKPKPVRVFMQNLEHKIKCEGLHSGFWGVAAGEPCT